MPPDYGKAVKRIAADCHRGMDVAFVTEGDPTLYSTASYVWQLLAELHPEVRQEIVPASAPFTAAGRRASAGRWPSGTSHCWLVPARGDRGTSELRRLIHDYHHVCLLKVPTALPQVLDALDRSGLSARRCTWKTWVQTANGSRMICPRRSAATATLPWS